MAARDKEIAATIRTQIGVGALMRMGAHKLGFVRAGLMFKVGSRRRVFVKVTLTAMDDYRVELITDRGGDVRTLDERDGVYADQLERAVLTLTGEISS